MKNTYFAEIVDHWEEELDILGPFNSEEEANAAAFDKWDGDDNVSEIRIIKRLPAFQGGLKQMFTLTLTIVFGMLFVVIGSVYLSI